MNDSFNSIKEKDFLNSLVSDYTDVSPYSQIKKDIVLACIDKFIDGKNDKRVLQLGCSNGYETEQLAQRFNQIDVIDGSDVFINKLKQQTTYKNVNFIYSLFEEFSVEEHGKYDYIFCNYILEHVYDPVEILKNLKSLLKHGGLLFVLVPNCNALSRKFAQKLGLLKELQDLTENDHKHGHRRVYNHSLIINDIKGSGFNILHITGIVFKILADFQLNELLRKDFFTEEHIKALQKLAEDDNNIDFSDSFFIVATN